MQQLRETRDDSERDLRLRPEESGGQLRERETQPEPVGRWYGVGQIVPIGSAEWVGACSGPGDGVMVQGEQASMMGQSLLPVDLGR